MDRYMICSSKHFNFRDKTINGSYKKSQLIEVKRQSDYETDTYPQFVERVTGITVTNKLDFHADRKT